MPFEQVEVLSWLLEVDKEETSSAYKNAENSCSCAYCRNFLEAYISLSHELLDLMDSLGIDPSKPAEITQFTENKDGSHFYSAMYNLVGKIISNSKHHPNPDPNSLKSLFLPFTEGISIYFSDEVYFPEKFPKPIIQFEFFANLPWVLSETP